MATVETIRQLKADRTVVKDHMGELDLDVYGREAHFSILGRRLLNLPGLLDFGTERFTNVDMGDALTLRLGCQYRTYVVTDNPKDLKAMTAVWTESLDRRSEPIFVQEVTWATSAEELFSFEQTLFAAEIQVGALPEKQLVVYKNEPAYLASISQHE